MVECLAAYRVECILKVLALQSVDAVDVPEYRTSAGTKGCDQDRTQG
jgi:hypothetical protein